MSAHDAAELIRQRTKESYPRVLSAYGISYANGWKTGRLRAAEMIEMEDQK